MRFYCTKNKCECSKHNCKTNRKYEYQKLPCVYMKSDECYCFDDINDLDGTKIRRQYFNHIIFYVFFILIIPLSLLMLYNTVFNASYGISFRNHTCATIIIISLVFLVPFFILSIFNRFAFGKTICVLTDKGLCCNQCCIKYEDIIKVEYHAQIWSRTRFYYNYAVIKTKDNEYKLPHAPLLLLSKLKKINPNIELSRISKSDKRLLIFYLTFIVIYIILAKK